MTQTNAAKQIVELVEHAKSISNVVRDAAVHFAPDGRGDDLVSDFREVAERLEELQNRCGAGKPNLLKCICHQSTTPNCRTIPSREFEGLQHVLCETCGGVAGGYEPTKLKNALMEQYQQQVPLPFAQFMVCNADRIDCKYELTPDEDGNAVVSVAAFELTGACDVRVLVRPDIPSEDVIAILRKVLEHVSAGELNGMSFDHSNVTNPHRELNSGGLPF